jgi:EmrB/QacA subfamily drug resistance transporter
MTELTDAAEPVAMRPEATPSMRADSAEARRWLTFVITSLGAFMGSLDLSIVNVAFPAMERAFPADGRAAIAWVITGYAIAFGALLVTAGRTADRLGRRRLFFTGLGVFALGSALCGVAPDAALLVAGRLVEGAGAAAMLPSSLGLLLEAFPPARRAQAVTLWGGIGALAVATGPTLGAIIVSTVGWRWVFYANLPLALAAWLVGRRVLAESMARRAAARPDFVGSVLVSVPLAALVLAISVGPQWGWTSAPILALWAIAIGAGIVLVYRSSHHPEPALDLALFEERRFSVANAATVLCAMALFAMLLGNILFLTSVWRYSIVSAGLAVTPGPLVVAAVSGPAGRLAGRVGFRPVLVTGALVFAAGLAGYALRVGLEPAFLSVWLPAALLTGLGVGLTFPVLSAAAVAGLPSDRFAVGSAVNQTARQVGGALGVAMLVAILGQTSSRAQALAAFGHMWLDAAAVVLLASLICLLLRPSRAPVA